MVESQSAPASAALEIDQGSTFCDCIGGKEIDQGTQ
jgi:hypothetical protein